MKLAVAGALLLVACGGSAGPGEVEMAVVGEDGGAVSQPPSEALEAMCSQWVLNDQQFSTQPPTHCHGASAASCSGDAGGGVCFRTEDDAGPYSRVTFSCAELATTAVPFCCCY